MHIELVCAPHSLIKTLLLGNQIKANKVMVTNCIYNM